MPEVAHLLSCAVCVRLVLQSTSMYIGARITRIIPFQPSVIMSISLHLKDHSDTFYLKNNSTQINVCTCCSVKFLLTSVSPPTKTFKVHFLSVKVNSNCFFTSYTVCLQPFFVVRNIT